MNAFLIRTLLCLLALSAVPAFAFNRSLKILAPATARPGAAVQVIVSTSTDASDAEQIGFFHTEYSTDGGKTWVPVYVEQQGESATRTLDLTAGAEGSQVIVRARTAFRGGKAGDVDFTGNPIFWNGSWAKWVTPPAKLVIIPVTTK